MSVRSVSVAAALAVVATISALAPSASAADEPAEVHYPPSKVRIPIILAGVGVFGAAYGLGVASSRYTPDIPGSGSLAVPIVGPWIALGQNACSASNPNCGALLELRGTLLVFEGIVQIAGTALVAEGIFMKTEPSKKTGLLEVKHGDFSLHPIPMTSKQFTGLGFSGTF